MSSAIFCAAETRTRSFTGACNISSSNVAIPQSRCRLHLFCVAAEAGVSSYDAVEIFVLGEALEVFLLVEIRLDNVGDHDQIVERLLGAVTYDTARIFTLGDCLYGLVKQAPGANDRDVR